MHGRITDFAIAMRAQINAVSFLSKTDQALLPFACAVGHFVYVIAVVETVQRDLADIADLKIGMQRLTEFIRFIADIGGGELHFEFLPNSDDVACARRMRPLRASRVVLDDFEYQLRAPVGQY